jgi:hypothetical protein
MGLRPKERIPQHDHSDRNSGGPVDGSTTSRTLGLAGGGGSSGASDGDLDALDLSKSSINVRHLITGGPPFKLIAHRGDINPVDGYPQDTLEAYRQAMIRGADGLEFGVQRDADGTWQCIHDTTVDATTDGTGAVSSKTTAQMAALNIDGGLGYDAGRHGTSLNVPTLDDALAAMLPYDPIIQFAPKEGTLESYTALATYVHAAGLDERSMIVGPLAGVAAAIHAIAPNILTADPSDPDVLIPEQSTVTSAAIVQGYEPDSVYPYFTDADWGTDETADLTNLWTYGCRGALTNDLPEALLWRHEVVDGATASTTAFTPAGTISATNVQDAIEEVAADAAAAATGIGPLLIASDHSSPIVFADILQASDGDDFLYASTP